MDIVTDLTQEAVAYLSLFQDMLKRQQRTDISQYLTSHRNWESIPTQNITISNLTAHQKEKLRDLVWHSPTKEMTWGHQSQSPDGNTENFSLAGAYFEIVSNLLEWIFPHIPTFPESWKFQDELLFRSPFFWRQQIRRILFADAAERLSLAAAIRYMPLQVIQVLGQKDDWAYTVRLRQHYISINVGSSGYDILSKADRESHDTWWKEHRDEAERLLQNDKDLLKLLKKDYPLPFETLFRDELIEISKARKARADEMHVSSGNSRNVHAASRIIDDKTIFDPLEQSKSMRLMGIALSGGGIRSATFNLGILQQLARLNVLHQFDYISTVSGGGYIGTFFNSWVKRSGSFSKITDRLNPEKASDPMADEVRPVRWLRMFSNYLTPNVGVMSPDAWAAGMTWLRNALVNQFVLLLILVTVLSLISDLFLLWKWEKGEMKLVQLTAGFAFAVSLSALLIGTVLAAIAMRTFYKPVNQEMTKTRLLKLTIAERFKVTWAWLTRLKVTVPGLIRIWGIICALALSTFFAATGQPPQHQNDRLYIVVYIGFAALIALVLLAVFGNYHKRLDLMMQGKLNVVGRGTISKPRNSDVSWLWFWIIVSSIFAAVIFAFLLDLYWEKMAPFYAKLCAEYDLDSEKMALVTGLPVILEIFSVAVIVRMALMGNLFPDYRREWWGMLGGNVHRLAAVWILVSFASLIMPDLYHYIPEVAVPAWGGWAGIVGWGVKKAYDSRDESKTNGKLTKILMKAVPFVFMIGFLLIGSWLMAWVKSINWIKSLELVSDDPRFLLRNLALTIGLGLFTWVFSWRVGVNEFSLHHFYRNRLIRAYMGATRTREDRTKTANAFTGFDTNDDIILSTMKVEDGYFGPFPLINTTLNSTVVSALDRQDRKAESFVFTPLYCGYDFSPTRASTYAIDQIYEYGYRPTEQFSNENGGPTIGTAMAISGAAFNPQQGHNTSALLAFLLTIFNVRLGWWIGNTRLEKWKRAEPGHGMIYLLADLMGRTDINKNYVCLSDGGHFDNMGLYELVRRRCSYILLGDGEQDQQGTCEGLANAIRRCRIDFGVEINIDLTPIMKKDKDKNSKHLVRGEIMYPGIKEKGTLIYIKTSLTGDEPVDIREYALVNEDFPQQSTADQFFDEAQFESYRKLGYHSIKNRQEIGL